jgi:hypothetical protein
MDTPQVLQTQEVQQGSPVAVQSFYGLINSSNVVINRVLWDGVSAVTWSNSLTPILDSTGICQIGGTWNGTTFIPPAASQTPQPTSTATLIITAPASFNYSANGTVAQGTAPYTVLGTETYFAIPVQSTMTMTVDITAGTPSFVITWPTQGPDSNTSEFVQQSSSVINTMETSLVISNTAISANNTTFTADINIVDGNGITTVITIPINDA